MYLCSFRHFQILKPLDLSCMYSKHVINKNFQIHMNVSYFVFSVFFQIRKKPGLHFVLKAYFTLYHDIQIHVRFLLPRCADVSYNLAFAIFRYPYIFFRFRYFQWFQISEYM